MHQWLRIEIRNRQTLRRIWMQSKWRELSDLISPTQSGKMNTASNLEHRMKVILKNAELESVKGGLHTFRKTFATRKYYIAIRKKLKTKSGVKQVVKLPESMVRSPES